MDRPERGRIMRMAVAGDSAGEGLAHILAEHLKKRCEAFDVSRVGDQADAFYANMADRVASAVLAGVYDRAILICGTGIGVSISANKIHGIRAALTHDTYSARRAALSNNAQIITMGARVIGPELAKTIADAYLDVAFDFDPNGPSGGNVRAIDAVDAKYASQTDPKATLRS
jgi:RpiB/LacA/LacB family sugar-phosphate isomerase